MSPPRQHVLLFPYPLFGHISPLLQLARKMAPHHDVTFVTSALRVQQLRQRGIFTAADEASIQLVGLLDALQESDDTEGTFQQMLEVGEKTFPFMTKLFRTLPSSASPDALGDDYRALLDRPLQRPVDVAIMDVIALRESLPLLHPRGIRCFVFNSSGLIFSNKLNVNQDTPALPDAAFFSDWEAHPDLAVSGVPRAFKEMCMDCDGELFPGLDALAGFIVNSIEELEPEVVRTMATHRKTAGKPVRFVAPLFADEAGKGHGNLVGEWLDAQGERSVVYVSFGSFAVSQNEQLHEIAKALLSLNKPFIWSLKSHQQKLLPPEMQASIAGQSASSKYLVLAWTPQRSILNHPATRLFVSHVGYNSLLETFDAGVPLVCWPMFGDQFANADMAQRLGNGRTIPDTGALHSRTVPAAEIAEAVTTVGQWERNFGDGDYARKAAEVSRMVKAAAAPGGSSCEAFTKLVLSDIPLA
ncbi:uncharacterized protein LOC129600328 [Paramacrobiotus metropolitanus]|uniref:uncharacterized protein LOC129600328 n=1 Tax=Paramacrobiotus metropolitanus TaxID=2943436 RepID=UPI0024457BE2|nr:uncharacterized protein LOC129600328 [Paramacrobiotus metropolitanus]